MLLILVPFPKFPIRKVLINGRRCKSNGGWGTLMEHCFGISTNQGLLLHVFANIALGVMHKLGHGLTGESRVRQIMTIYDGLGGGVTRLRYDIIHEQIHLKKTPENSLNVRMFFKLGTLATFL